ncbi:caffeic acid 3-O-methyltransferase 1-like [Chenopodium quinoa]|uniref:Uncharacterized protein n=1 Tax=Chenopodium quinoa TaxID=63459 RepID=A0A803L297_CHEQI|nr:caffeic acid 3-O-methyltransferase 1-like [Chenopodium quinoa]
MASNTANNVDPMNPFWSLGAAEEDEGFCLAASLVTASITFGVFKAVKDLKVFEVIKKSGPNAPLTAAEIVAKLPTENPGAAAAALGRMLDLLVGQSVLTATFVTLPDGTGQRCYGLAPACKFLTPDEDGISLAPKVSMYKAMIESSLFLKDAVVEGVEPFTKAHGMSYYEYFGEKAERREEFHEGMASHSILIMRKILRTYKGFEGISMLVDVGGGNGATLSMILSQYPNIKGINFDQLPVVANAPPYPGVEHVGGNIFVNIPKGDAIFLKWICHCFKDEACIMILKNCYDALPEDHGKVIICEGLRPDPQEITTSVEANSILQLDMVMMATTGGKERTEKEFEALAFAAGFQGFQVACSAYNAKVMELLKNN